jgi:hypothetical protein
MAERDLNVIVVGMGLMVWASIVLVPAIRHRWSLLAGSAGLLLCGLGSGLLVFGDAQPIFVTPRSTDFVIPPVPGPIVRSRDEVRHAPANPVSWRISPDQREIFKNYLKSAGVTASVIIRLDNANSAIFKNDLASMIGSTPGWSVFDFGDSGIDTIGIAGISIQVPDAESPPPAATALMKAFLAARIEPMPVLSGGFNAVQIVIGAPQADVAAPATE